MRRQKIKTLAAWKTLEKERPDIARDIRDAVLEACELLQPLESAEQLRAFREGEHFAKIRTLLTSHGDQLGIKDADSARLQWVLTACLGFVMKSELGLRTRPYN